MNTFFYFLIAILPIAALGYLAYFSFKKKAEGKPFKKVMLLNFTLFLLILVVASLLTFSVSAETSITDNEDQNNNTENIAEDTATNYSKGMGLLAAGLVTGLAGIGGGIAVAAGAPAAIAATSEDPKVFGKALIFVALGESIALYGVVISILILNKI
ncbi:MAG: hypothetical protein A2Y15_02360 [Clostridiales bacterium GWF2_36_10]|nr:MAG: hypothetical protein A2Y15_02360 [Clostridiales bacterium GWF2_36_10]